MKRADTKNDAPEIMAVFRNRAKALGISQVELARKLRVSVPTLKRWLSGKGVALDALIRLMDVLELSLSDVSESVSHLGAKTFTYTLEQERFFAGNPAYLAYFDLLLAGASPALIARRFKLTKHSTRKYLLALDRLSLIELHAGDRVRIRASGEPAWIRGGPLSQALRPRALRDFIEAAGESITLQLHDYTTGDRERIQQLIQEIRAIAGASDKRGKMFPRDAHPHGLLIGLAPFKWSLLNSVPNLK